MKLTDKLLFLEELSWLRLCERAHEQHDAQQHGYCCCLPDAGNRATHQSAAFFGEADRNPPQEMRQINQSNITFRSRRNRIPSHLPRPTFARPSAAFVHHDSATPSAPTAPPRLQRMPTLELLRRHVHDLDAPVLVGEGIPGILASERVSRLRNASMKFCSSVERVGSTDGPRDLRFFSASRICDSLGCSAAAADAAIASTMNHKPAHA
jgi:hypothetical protein